MSIQAKMFARSLSEGATLPIRMNRPSHTNGANHEEGHDTSWSINLEKPRHEADRDRILREAFDAIRHTAPGRFVNLVTHEAHGHPSTYLYSELRDRFGSAIELEYVAQCGCGGYTTRAHVESAVGIES